MKCRRHYKGLPAKPTHFGDVCFYEVQHVCLIHLILSQFGEFWSGYPEKRWFSGGYICFGGPILGLSWGVVSVMVLCMSNLLICCLYMFIWAASHQVTLSSSDARCWWWQHSMSGAIQEKWLLKLLKILDLSNTNVDWRRGKKKRSFTNTMRLQWDIGYPIYISYISHISHIYPTHPIM